MMGIRISFEDDIIRDVKDIQAGILIQEVLYTLEIQFERIVITQTDEEGPEIEGLSKEDLKKWR